MDRHELVDKLRSFLDQIVVLNLATVDDAGNPYATSLYFVADPELNLYFMSDTKTAHAHHIAAHPMIAASLHAPARMWQQVRGVQLRGVCEAVGEDERKTAHDLYLLKFPHIKEVPRLVEEMTFYRLRPTWIRWTDNSVHFGYKFETTWPLPAAS